MLEQHNYIYPFARLILFHPPPSVLHAREMVDSDIAADDSGAPADYLTITAETLRDLAIPRIPAMTRLAFRVADFSTPATARC